LSCGLSIPATQSGSGSERGWVANFDVIATMGMKMADCISQKIQHLLHYVCQGQRMH